VGGAREVSVHDRCQPLYVRPKHLGEGFAFGVAQLREFLGDM
jgi:hypothetical protein